MWFLFYQLWVGIIVDCITISNRTIGFAQRLEIIRKQCHKCVGNNTLRNVFWIYSSQSKNSNESWHWLSSKFILDNASRKLCPYPEWSRWSCLFPPNEWAWLLGDPVRAAWAPVLWRHHRMSRLDTFHVGWFEWNRWDKLLLFKIHKYRGIT